jgi:hypothetical protein
MYMFLQGVPHHTTVKTASAHTTFPVKVTTGNISSYHLLLQEAWYHITVESTSACIIFTIQVTVRDGGGIKYKVKDVMVYF